jgi:hypothetical protein
MRKAITIFTLLMVAMLAGCQNQHNQAVDADNAIHKDSAAIQTDATAIASDLDVATKTVGSAASNPATPPTVANDLRTAHQPLADASKHTQHILTTLPKIDTLADKQVAITDKVIKQIEEIKSTWGYRIELALKWILGLSVLALIIYLIVSGGNVPALIGSFGITWVIARLHAHKVAPAVVATTPANSPAPLTASDLLNK